MPIELEGMSNGGEGTSVSEAGQHSASIPCMPIELKGVSNEGEGTSVSEAGQLKLAMAHANLTEGDEQWG